MFDGTKHTALETSAQKTHLKNLFRVGTIEEIRDKVEEPPQDEEQHNWTNEDLQGNFRGQLARVKMGEGSPEERHKTYWIPFAADAAGVGGTSYKYFSVGDQVLVICESGNPMSSWIIGHAYQDAARPPKSWDQPTKDGRAWDSHLLQFQTEDGSYFEWRDSTCPVVPNNGRWLFSGFRDDVSLFEYYTHPEKRQLHVHIKEIHIELDGSYTLQMQEDGTVEIQGDYNTTVEGDSTITTKKLIIQAQSIELNADQKIELNAPIISATSSQGSSLTLGGGNNEITSSKNNVITAAGANKLTDGAGAHGHS